MPYKTMTVKNTEVDNIELEMNSLYYLEAPVQRKADNRKCKSTYKRIKQ